MVGCRITDMGFVRISEMKGLHVLNLRCCTEITDSSFPQMAGLTTLRYLALVKCGIGDEGFTKLCELSTLTSLSIILPTLLACDVAMLES